MRHRNSWVLVVGVGLLASAQQQELLAQAPSKFQAPPQSVAFEDNEGTFEGAHGDIVQIRDSKSEAWYLQANADTKITVKGEAEEDCLRPGVFVELNGEVDKKWLLSEPVSEITIFAISGKPTVGLFPPSDPAEPASEDAKPVRNAGPGKYRIRAKLVLFKDGEIVMLAGNRRIVGDVAEKLTVNLHLDDLSIAQEGDKLEVKAWYYDPHKPAPLLNRPGKALAEEIVVTLSKPLTSGKKSRPIEKPVKAPGKSKSATRN
jgi:hypothetical protein